MQKTYFKTCCLLIALFSLTGCGFSLRSTQSLPSELHKVYLQTDNPYGRLEKAFKRSLKSSNVVLLTAPDKKYPIIHIDSNYTSSTTESYSSTAARTYDLNYTATVSISDFSQESLIKPQTIKVTRDITLQPNELIETTPQIATVKQNMRQELITKILNILGSPKSFKALNDTYKTSTKNKNRMSSRVK